MADETGLTEQFRVRFPTTMYEVLVKRANLESRSIPNLIQYLVIKELVREQVEENVESFIKDIISNGNGKR